MHILHEYITKSINAKKYLLQGYQGHYIKGGNSVWVQSCKKYQFYERHFMFRNKEPYTIPCLRISFLAHESIETLNEDKIKNLRVFSK